MLRKKNAQYESLSLTCQQKQVVGNIKSIYMEFIKQCCKIEIVGMFALIFFNDELYLKPRRDKEEYSP